MAAQSNNALKGDVKKRLWIFPLCIVIVSIIGGLFADKFLVYISANFTQLKGVFWGLAFGWSTFLALYAFQLHTKFHGKDPDFILKGYGKLRWPQRIHQFALNFVGGMIGWTIIYFFLYTEHLSSFAGWEKIILLFIAFLAVLGYLPYSLIVKSWLPGR